MLADNESEKSKWVIALGELHRILKRNNLPNTAIYKVNEILDNTLSIIRNALCSVITYPNQILLGTEDGLFYLNLDTYGELFAIINFIIATISIIHIYCKQILQKLLELVKQRKSFNYGI